MRYSKRRLDSSANERCREEVIADQVIRYANMGAPTREVIMPRGISVTLTVLARSSTSNMKDAPHTMLMGSRRL